MSLPDEIEELQEGLDTDDVGQKRYLMNAIFDKALKHRYSAEGKDHSHESGVRRLQNMDGYMYKLAQDFLTSSSTFEKQKKLEKMLDHMEKQT